MSCVEQMLIYGYHIILFVYSFAQATRRFLSPSTATVVYLGPNAILFANNETGGSFPIMAYSTTDNASLTYTIDYGTSFINLVNNSIVVAPGTPAQAEPYFVDVSIILLL